MTPRHQAALDLAAQGVPVIPLRGKIPAVGHGFKSESADPDQINEWWSREDYNIGVRPCHMGLVAIDLDHAKPGGVSQAFLDLLPPTRTHRTPSSGEHRLYLSIETYGNAVVAQNVDVRSANGYILWPPSIINGVEYRVEDDREPEMLPERLARNMRTKAEADAPEPCDDTGVDADEVGAREWCAKLKEQGDYDRFALAAGLVRNFGLTDSTATALCVEFGLRTWTLNGSETTWQQTLNNARKHGKGVLGEGVAFKYDEPKPIPEAWKVVAAANTCESATAKPNNRFGGRTPSEGRNLPEITYWDSHNTFPKIPCVGMVIGESGTHKTGLLLKYALDIVEAGGRLIYFAAEGARGIETARIPRAVAMRIIDEATLDDRWRTESETFDLLSSTDQDLFYEAYKDFRPDAIIMDVLTLFTSVDINTPQGSAAIMLAANKMAFRFNCPVVFAHHPGKDKSRGSLGGTLLKALAYFEWMVEMKGDKIWLTVSKMKDGEAHFSVPYGIDSTQGIPVIVDCERTPDEVKPPDELALRIRAFLDGTNPDHEWFSCPTLYRELVKLNNPPALTPGCTERQGVKEIQDNLHGIGNYLVTKGEGKGKSYRFAKPRPAA